MPGKMKAEEWAPCVKGAVFCSLSSKQRFPKSVSSECGEQRQGDAAQAHAREEHRPQRNGHPGQGAQRDSGRKYSPPEYIGCRQPQRGDEGRRQTQHKSIRAGRAEHSCHEIVVQRLVAVTGREINGEMTAQDVLRHLADNHLVVMQAGRHIVQLPDAQAERDQQQADHDRPFPTQTLVSGWLHPATCLAPCRSPAALPRPLSLTAAGDRADRRKI